MAPVAHPHYISLLSCLSPSEDTTDLPVDHMPTGGIPCVLPVAFRHWHPFPGLGTMPNRIPIYVVDVYNKEINAIGQVGGQVGDEQIIYMKDQVAYITYQAHVMCGM